MSRAKARTTPMNRPATQLATTPARSEDVEAAHPETEYATVRSTLEGSRDGGHPVALWEVDDLHPGGEVLIAGPTPVRAALTPQVTALIRDGILEEGDFEPGVVPDDEE